MNNTEYLIHRVEEACAHQEMDPRTLIACIDLTSLNATDNDEIIAALCVKARSAQVAAVCVYPAFVAQAKVQLAASSIYVATVANFPSGTELLSDVLHAIEHALTQGADEIDVVIPYQAYLEHQDTALIKHFVQACKKLLPTQCLKIILESGALHDAQALEHAALASLEGGADFLKTSTGKIAQGASLASVIVMIRAIQRFGDIKRGLKVSGGIHTYVQAKMYYVLTQIMLGDYWPNKNTFRIGASRLLEDLLGNDHDRQ